MSTKVGRPKGKTNNRLKIIRAARVCFTDHHYEKVSMREISDLAGVNVATVTYYFSTKECLFFTMLKETMIPIYKRMAELIESSDGDLRSVMRVYYVEMLNYPHFPQLVLQALNVEGSQEHKVMLESVYKKIKKPVQDAVYKQVTEGDLIQDGVNPYMAEVSFFTMLVAPFLMPNVYAEMSGVKFDEEYLMDFLEHNMRLLQTGILR